jgi:hypothetical protein
MDYDESKFKAKTWKNWAMLHWQLNPAMMVGELFFGIRLPKVYLVDTRPGKPVAERHFVPCPHCGKINEAKLWSGKNGFKNWFGYYCPNCGKVIPCLWNFASLLVLFMTFPVWIWFRKRLK